MKRRNLSIRRWVLAVAALMVLILIVVGGWTFADAWEAGMLPWQPEPTRVVVTPFANLPTVEATP
jgi:hypothetical protein